MVIERVYAGAWCLDQERRVWVVPKLPFLAAKSWCWVLLSEQIVWGLTGPELQAIVAHELGHSWWHQLSRMIVKSLAPALLPDLIRKHELQADDHAKQQGLGHELASALLKFKDIPQKGDYPPLEERVRRLTC